MKTIIILLLVIAFPVLADSTAVDRILHDLKKDLARAEKKYRQAHKKAVAKAVAALKKRLRLAMRRTDLASANRIQARITKLQKQSPVIVLKTTEKAGASATAALKLTLESARIEEFREGARIVSNRRYTIMNIPKQLASGYKYTLIPGGGDRNRVKISFVPARKCVVYLARHKHEHDGKVVPVGWIRTNLSFQYNDRQQSTMAVFSRVVLPGTQYRVEQQGWAGCILIFRD